MTMTERNSEWPSEFLGRCGECLDNAYLHRDCSVPDRGYSQCLVRRVRQMNPELRKELTHDHR